MSKYLLGYSKILIKAKFDTLVTIISGWSKLKCYSSGVFINFACNS